MTVRPNKKIILSACLFASFLGIIFLSFALYIGLFKPMLARRMSPQLLEVPSKTTAVQLVNQLRSKQLIHIPYALLAYMHFYGYSSHLKAGVYRIYPLETPVHFIKRVIAGDVLTQTLHIIEGTTLLDLRHRLSQAPYLHFNASDIEHLTKPYSSAEGLFLADTYQYGAMTPAYPLLNKARKNLSDCLQVNWESRNKDLPYKNPYELLIAASILEKESALPSERKIIAGIIARRLKLNMPLQMDPTVIYGLYKKYGHVLTHADLTIDTPYNTYLRRGLPPTPIAMVSKASIEAAAHPTPSSYLYFYAKGDGSHQFSSTYQEQKAAINRYKYRAVKP